MAEQSVERFDQPMLFDQYLGQLDMENHNLWEEAWIGQDQKKFEQILYEMGADLAYGYDFRVCNYRPRTSKHSEYGVRVGFKERTDKWWVTNMMSISDIVRHVSEREGTIRSVGMRESLMEDSSMHSVMVAAAERYVVSADIVVKDKEDTADLIEEVK